jgi:hypothetical protein
LLEHGDGKAGSGPAKSPCRGASSGAAAMLTAGERPSCATGAHDRVHRDRSRVTRARHGSHRAPHHADRARVRTTKVPLHVTRWRRARASGDLSSTREAQSRANAHSAGANALLWRARGPS